MTAVVQFNLLVQQSIVVVSIQFYIIFYKSLPISFRCWYLGLRTNKVVSIQYFIDYTDYILYLNYILRISFPFVPGSNYCVSEPDCKF